MYVSDIMTARPITISQHQTLGEALHAMREIGCHHLPVLGSDGHIIGIVTEGDCRRALRIPGTAPELWKENAAANEMQVRMVMTPAPIIVESDMSADEATRLMLTHHITCLPVMRSETLVGIITTSDILMAFIRMHKQAPRESLPSARPPDART